MTVKYRKTLTSLLSLLIFSLSGLLHAGSLVWTFTPLTATTISVSTADTATIQYQVTNQSRKTHVLEMRGITGISQNTTSGNCANPFTLGYQQSCTLTLTVDGSSLQGSVAGGPVVCQQGNALQCYQPSRSDALNITLTTAPGATTLSTSVSHLALSQTGYTEYGVSGTPISGLARTITVTNTGSNTTSNLSISYPTWPSGTTASSNCGSSLAASATCTITIAPGNTATSNGVSACTSGVAPTLQTISISADNASTVSSTAVILGYGCIYQGGYVYAFDDTTPNTGSVGGKIATTSDQAAAYPNGIVWSSNGGTGGGSGGFDSVDVSYDTLPGIDETSTSSTGSPTYATFSSFFSSTYTNPNPFTSASFSLCNGNSEGACNTGNIVTLYNQFITNNTLGTGGSSPFTASAGPTNITYYAAGLCKQAISGSSDWYLPAICEMGYDTYSQGSGCGTSGAPTLQNIQSSLIDSSGFSAPAGYYWSSTEHSGVPRGNAWYQYFAASSLSSQNFGSKSLLLSVRCSRALTI